MKLGLRGGVVPTLNAFDIGDTRATVLISETQKGDVPMVFPIDDARELEKHQNGTGIGEEGAPAYTLDRLQAPAIVTAFTVRRLTPVECERLQGFPDNWTFEQSDSTRYKQIGNAVAVPVVDWIIKNLIEVTR